MTPNEKAHQLVRAFGYEIGKELPNGGYKYNIETAKKLALIAVEEIIELCEFDVAYDVENHRYAAQLNYWDEVKQEIEKL